MVMMECDFDCGVTRTWELYILELYIMQLPPTWALHFVTWDVMNQGLPMACLILRPVSSNLLCYVKNYL